ncbi:MAG: hypothetical protein HOV68_22650, partial [Streptomycetaceae bacterium]|nr:hypothetical protein [Streptomycetaceae bacterium]
MNDAPDQPARPDPPDQRLWCEIVHTRTGIERDVVIGIRDGRITEVR